MLHFPLVPFTCLEDFIPVICWLRDEHWRAVGHEHGPSGVQLESLPGREERRAHRTGREEHGQRAAEVSAESQSQISLVSENKACLIF